MVADERWRWPSAVSETRAPGGRLVDEVKSAVRRRVCGSEQSPVVTTHCESGAQWASASATEPALCRSGRRTVWWRGGGGLGGRGRGATGLVATGGGGQAKEATLADCLGVGATEGSKADSTEAEARGRRHAVVFLAKTCSPASPSVSSQERPPCSGHPGAR